MVVQVDLLLRVELLEELQHDVVRLAASAFDYRGGLVGRLLWGGGGALLCAALDDFHLTLFFHTLVVVVRCTIFVRLVRLGEVRRALALDVD